MLWSWLKGEGYSNVICVKFSVRLFWILLLSARCASPNNVYCTVVGYTCAT